jgi:uncharacterized protein
VSCFADSSALVKLYATEVGRPEVLAAEQLTMLVSDLARVEVPAALWKKHRAGELSSDDAQLLAAQFTADQRGTRSTAPRWPSLTVTRNILDNAGHLAAVHSLRAYDAVQLATALAARAVDPSVALFVCFDKGLNKAAATEGFNLVASITAAPGP